MGNDLLRDHLHELSALAAECGIDWPATADRIHGPGKYEHPAVLHRKYRGRCVIFVTEFESRSGGKCVRLTFCTQKHGGINRTWTSGRKRSGAALRSLGTPSKDNAGDQGRRRSELFETFKKAFAAAPQADPAHPYLVRKSISEVAELIDLRLLTDHRVFGQGTVTPYLCLPIQSPKGEYVGFQRIYGDGIKKLTSGLWDGQYRGAFAVLGDPDDSSTLYIVEGFATGARAGNDPEFVKWVRGIPIEQTALKPWASGWCRPRSVNRTPHRSESMRSPFIAGQGLPFLADNFLFCTTDALHGVRRSTHLKITAGTGVARSKLATGWDRGCAADEERDVGNRTEAIDVESPLRDIITGYTTGTAFLLRGSTY